MSEQIFVPAFLKRRVARKIINKRSKFEEIDLALQQSRLPLTLYELISISSFYSFISFLIGTLVGVYILTQIKSIILSIMSFLINNVNNLLFKLSLPPIPPLFLNYYWLFGIIIGLIAYRLTKYIILSYPFFIAKKRKNEIELYLPHAINMMYSMAVGGLNPLDIIKEIAKLENLFGELSREFSEIVKNFEIFKKDLFSSMRYVRDTTPSQKFAGFLDNMIMILQGGGSFSQYLKSKSEEFVEEQELVFNEAMSFMEILSEIYISVFVLLPMLMLVVMVVAKFASGQIMDGYIKIIYVILPIASAFIIYLAKSSIPSPKISVVFYAESYPKIIANVHSLNKNRYKVLRFRRFLKKVLRIILHPYKESLVTMKLSIAFLHIVLYSSLIILVIHKYFGFSLEDKLIIFVSIVFTILVSLIEIRHRIIKKAEEKLPEVFTELAMLNESGLSIFEGLKLLSKMELGILTKEISTIRKELELGVSIPESFIRLGIRIKSDIFAKVIPVAVKALETSYSIKDAFTAVARYAESELNFRKRLSSNLMPYIMIIYMSVGVFIFVSYLMITKFLSLFSSIGVGTVGMIGISGVDVEVIRLAFFRVMLLISFLSGIIAGVISQMKISSGLKHSFILVFLTYISYKYLITL